MNRLLAGILILMLCSCGTFIAQSHLSDPCVTKFPRYMYKGIRIDASWMVNGAAEVDPLMFVKGLVDFPFSLLADTVFFPASTGREFFAKNECAVKRAGKPVLLFSQG